MGCREEFDAILKSTNLSNNPSKEEFNQVMQPLMQFIWNKAPSTLYKFRECSEYSFDAFAKDEIWLSKAKLFNDLHDSLIFFDKQAILDYTKKMLTSQNLQNTLTNLKSETEPLEQMVFSNPEVKKQIAEKLNVLGQQEVLNILNDFLQVFDIFLDQAFSELKESVRNQTKMACFSGNIRSPLMWAHYANNNKGFAIGYDFRGGDISQCSFCPNRSCGKIRLATIYPMIYSDKRFDATAYGMWQIEQYIKRNIGIQTETDFDDPLLALRIALYKSNDWAYEDEWRIICSTPDSLDNQSDRYPISKKPIAIYFGCQIPNIYREMLIHIADEKGIAKYQMYVKDDSQKYELDFRPI